MPYIEQGSRTKFEDLEDALCTVTMYDSGDLNYVLTRVIQRYLAVCKPRYRVFNDIIGALEACKLEFYRRAVTPYENRKISENGDVY